MAILRLFGGHFPNGWGIYRTVQTFEHKLINISCRHKYLGRISETSRLQIQHCRDVGLVTYCCRRSSWHRSQFYKPLHVLEHQVHPWPKARHIPEIAVPLFYICTHVCVLYIMYSNQIVKMANDIIMNIITASYIW